MATPRRSPSPTQQPAAAATREVVLSLAMSLDGYIARPDGRVDWLVMDPEIDMRAFFRSIDVIVAGRKTLGGAEDHGGGGDKSMAHIKCYVFSRVEKPGARNGVEYVNCPPSELIQELRKNPGKDIWLMGGGKLTREFLREDLVDRMELAIIPVVLGDGIPLFPRGFPQRDFQFDKERVFSTTGTLSVIYKRIRGRAARSRQEKAGQ